MALDRGDNIRLEATFKDVDDALTDPTVVTFKMKEPDNTVTTYVYLTDSELSRVSIGLFRVDWPITKSGKHWYRYIGTGAIEAAEEDQFHVKKSKFV